MALTDIESAHQLVDFELKKAYQHSDDAVVYILNAKGVVYDIQGAVDSALIVFNMAEILCPKAKRKDRLLAKTLNNKAIVFKHRGQLQYALSDAMKSYRLRKKLRDTLGLMRTLNTVTTVFTRLNLLDSAITYAHQSAIISLELDKKLEVGNCLMTKGNLECALDKWEGALKSYRKAFSVFEELDMKNNMGDVWFAFGNVALAGYQQNDSALICYGRALKSYRESNDFENQVACLDALGSTYFHMGELDKAERLELQSLTLADSIADGIGIRTTSLHLARLYTLQGRISKAKAFINKAEKVKAGLSQLEDIYWKKRELYLANGDLDSALHYTDLFHDFVDSVKSEKTLSREQEYIAKHQVLKHDQGRQVAELKAEKAQRQSQRLVLAVVVLGLLIVALVVVALLIRQNLRNKALLAKRKEEVQVRKVENLKKQAKLDRVSNLMEGQEQERSRISRELHDSLGNLLSTVKIHFGILQTSLDKRDEQSIKVVQLLDQAHSEVRRISHDMASNVLSKFGLAAAVMDLVENLNESNTLQVDFLVNKKGDDIEGLFEIHLFRIVQEAVNNILKHSRATKVTINLCIWKEEINLIIEDNGVGFSFYEIKDNRSMGFSNLQARVDLMNGKLNIDSSKGSGTSLVVEIPLN